MTDEIAVIGAGNMGTALAQVAANNGHPVRLWSIEHDVLEDVRDNRLNTKYLEGIALNDNITPVWDLAEAVTGARLVILSVSSQVVRRVAHDFAPHIVPGQIVLNVAKGLEADTHLRMSEVICDELADDCDPFVGSMAGPAIAIEMARGGPLAVIVGVTDADGGKTIQQLLQNIHLKVETTRDVTGLELCATLKNIYAISLGICDGLGFGTNTKAFFASLALEEMAAIVADLGGDTRTVYGLAGIGDLLTTGFSEHSRNRTLGEKLGSDGDWRHFIETSTVEGYIACQEVSELLENRHLETQLLDTIHAVMYQDRPAGDAIRNFFADFAYS